MTSSSSPTLRNHRHDARGRERDAAAAEGDALLVHDDPERRSHVVEIVERLAHAHHDDVAEHARRLGGRRPFAIAVARHHELADDLGRRQVAHQGLRAGVAEAAGERAADLARDADRAAILLGDVDRLGLVAVGEAQQPFARAVGRALLGDDLGPLDHEQLGQAVTRLLGDVGHAAEIGHAMPVDPLPDLAGAERLQPGLDQGGLQVLARQADQVAAQVVAAAPGGRLGDLQRLGGQGRHGRGR